MKINSLVSVIIPCFNAERWLREAIESCLAQNYAPLEIIVVDDGSTDRSSEVAQSYGPRIQLLTGPNRGGGNARNRGFLASRGRYIQYLDADDCLLPDKIMRQVQFLTNNRCDGVYGDWRHLFHSADGSIQAGENTISGPQLDILGALLDQWWVPLHSYLFRRSAILAGPGWDESLKAAQDKDFVLSLVVAGADIQYLSGCETIYRRYGDCTVSTSNRQVWLECHSRVLDKVYSELQQTGRLKLEYRRSLARAYFKIARSYYNNDAALYKTAMDKVLTLNPNFKPSETHFYKIAHKLFGFTAAEWLASRTRSLRRPRQAARL